MRHPPLRWWESLLAVALAVGLAYVLWGRRPEPPCEFRADRWNRSGCVEAPLSHGGIP